MAIDVSWAHLEWANTMATLRTHIVLPAVLARDHDESPGPCGRTAFFEETAAKEIKRRRLQVFLANGCATSRRPPAATRDGCRLSCLSLARPAATANRPGGRASYLRQSCKHYGWLPFEKKPVQEPHVARALSAMDISSVLRCGAGETNNSSEFA